ncbi:MAG TPA: phosphoglucosamine mutase [Acidimicrobiales bacterium]|nr:phosphoglucosamine mutase [Acidimicrobiales bacterium]
MRFGTDGLRGVAGAELTPELALALGRAAARVLGADQWFVGRDPRRSGALLSAAFVAGLAAEGAEVADLGVLPTPGVAFWAEAEGAPAAVVSASHNPFADNGIKLFGPGGRKLSDDIERRIELELHAGATLRSGLDLGTVAPFDGARRYADHLSGTLEGRSLTGLRVVIDTAHGAAAGLGQTVLRGLGCDVVAVLGDAPDGVNINLGCGSTHLGPLADAVLAAGADVGIALDGDADRCLAVDHRGQVVDGDQLLALLALDLRARGRLDRDTLVVTVMSNLGLHLAMAEAGVHLETTAVGDRYVLDRMEEGGFALGGEQSGHVIVRRLATTGDGLLSALQVLDVMHRTGRPLAELAGVVQRLPQVLVNVRVAGSAKEALAGSEAVWAAVAQVQSELGDHGRVLLRPSGTEPLVRVMVEAPTDALAREAAARIAKVVEATLA